MFAAVATAHGEWVSDSWIHLGSVRAMSQNLWSPAEPLVGEDVPFPYYSPWTLVAALAVRLTSVSPAQAVGAFGVLSPFLLVVAFHRLVRTISAAAWAPVLALAAFITVWGTRSFFWSGFLSLDTLVVGPAWPSVLATALWFLLWAAVWSSTEMTRGFAALLLVLPAVLILIHPFTFICAAVSCALTALVRWKPRRWLSASALCLSSVALAALWPWTSLVDLLDNPRGFDDFHEYFYLDVLPKLGLLLLTVPAVVLRLVRDRRDPLGWCVVAGVGLWIAGGVLDVQSLARVLPLATTSATIALGVSAAETLQRPGPEGAPSERTTKAWWYVTVVCWVIAVGLGASVQADAWSRVTPDAQSRRDHHDGTHIIAPYPDVGSLLARVPEGAVVLAPQASVRRQLPASGLLTVSPQWPSPGVDDAVERMDAQVAILGRDTPPGTRAALVDRYRVGWVVWPASRRIPSWLVERGTRVATAAGQILFQVR